MVRPRGVREAFSIVRTLGHALGVVFLILAAAALVAQALSYYASHTYQPIALATIWVAVSANSLVGFGGFVENRISPAAWQPVVWVLGLPAWLVLGILGLVLMLSCRRRRRRAD